MYTEISKYMVEKLDLSDVNDENKQNDNIIQLELRKINNRVPREKYDNVKLLKYMNKKQNENDIGELLKIWNSDIFEKKKFIFKPLKKKKKLTPFQIIVNENEENKKIIEQRKTSNSLRKTKLILTNSNSNIKKSTDSLIPKINTRKYQTLKNYKLWSIKPRKIITKNVGCNTKNSISNNHHTEKIKKIKTRINKLNYNRVLSNTHLNVNSLKYHVIENNKKFKINSFTEIK